MDYLYTFCFYYMRFPTKVKRCTESLQSGPADLAAMRPFLFLFVEKCVILVLRPCPPTLFGREVKAVIHILTILESVIANVISHYICKWLDRLDKDRKPD